jgi:hypothetical protein
MRHSWTKNAFWAVSNKKWRKLCKFVSPFLFNNTYSLPVLKMDTKCPNQVFSLVDLKTICAKKRLETWLFPNNDIRKRMLDMKHCWLKTHFETWIIRNDVNGVKLFHHCYLITLMDYLCSQWTRIVQMKYSMFDWSIYRLFVLNRGWKRDSLQIMVFVYVCSTWSLVELKSRFETWKT